MRTTTLTATSTSGGGHKVAVLAAGLLAATLTAATDLYVSADVSTDNCSGFPQYSGGLAGPWPVVMDRVNSDLNGDGAYPLSMDDSGGPSVIWVTFPRQKSRSKPGQYFQCVDVDGGGYLLQVKSDNTTFEGPLVAVVEDQTGTFDVGAGLGTGGTTVANITGVRLSNDSGVLPGVYLAVGTSINWSFPVNMTYPKSLGVGLLESVSTEPSDSLIGLMKIGA